MCWLTLEDAIAVVPAAKARQDRRKQPSRPWCTGNEDGDRERISGVNRKLSETRRRLILRKKEKPSPYTSFNENETDNKSSSELNMFRIPSYSTREKEWSAVLHPMSYHHGVAMARSVRDHVTMKASGLQPPMSTLYVRWHGNENFLVYNVRTLYRIFIHFGEVRKITITSPCSATVVFKCIESACRALSMRNLGQWQNPLHMRWLPNVPHVMWDKEESRAQPYVVQHPPIKERGDSTTPPATMRSSQITCSLSQTQLPRPSPTPKESLLTVLKNARLVPVPRG
ncbi:uncharacterized protein LOC116618519 [Nematostella vectensis]|uniref:uncharacterized protein LOC116618519 n=1 Tax=Nematostella vectensis TaxID=45351 RepID=UPI00138FC990|nr:uncharacterized protein LOC116618519 [Nematostella vectensis]